MPLGSPSDIIWPHQAPTHDRTEAPRSQLRIPNTGCCCATLHKACAHATKLPTLLHPTAGRGPRGRSCASPTRAAAVPPSTRHVPMQSNSPHLYTPLLAGGPEVAAAHPQHGLLLCYSPPGSPTNPHPITAGRGPRGRRCIFPSRAAAVLPSARQPDGQAGPQGVPGRHCRRRGRESVTACLAPAVQL